MKALAVLRLACILDNVTPPTEVHLYPRTTPASPRAALIAKSRTLLTQFPKRQLSTGIRLPKHRPEPLRSGFPKWDSVVDQVANLLPMSAPTRRDCREAQRHVLD